MPQSSSRTRADAFSCAADFTLYLGFLLVTCACARAASGVSDRVDFNFQVKPILADRCFTCHGPDERARKAGLRLDQKEGAVGLRPNGSQRAAIVPGHPDKSELYARITSTDPDVVMPPQASKLSLTKAEKEILRQWITQGAEYRSHWAFIPFADATNSEGGQSRGNPVDQFVGEDLKRKGMGFSPEAGRETLIRRLSLDLRGLPPTLEEIDGFLADKSNDAYNKLVDQFLASPAYGEHQAKGWMDVARFADTYGYQADVERDFTPWRDWVIRAFNENLPFDRFILWQIAGDLLPDASHDQVLATAFNRLHRQTNEGGSIEEEFRAEYVADRVETMGTAFLGLTLACARCHDHKYDPISQKDFYRLSAFFNNVDESGLYSHFTTATPTPTLLLYKPGEKVAHEAFLSKIREAEARTAAVAHEATNRFQSSPSNQLEWPVADTFFPFDEITNGTSPDRYSTNFTAIPVESPKLADGYAGKAFLFNGDNSVVLKGAGNFDRTDCFSFDFWLRPGEAQPRAVLFHRSRSWTDSGSRGYELLLEDQKLSFALIHFWPGNAIKVQAKDPLPLKQWSHVTITYDGSSRVSGIRLYIDGKQAEVDHVRNNLSRSILHRSEWGDSDVGQIELTLAGRFRDSGFKNGAVDEFRIFHRMLTAGEVRKLHQPDLVANDRHDLIDFYVNHVDDEYRAAAELVVTARREENQFVTGIREMMVMKEMNWRRPTPVLKRGAYDAPGELVEPGTPDAIMPYDKKLPANRLGLAKWLIDPKNPLTARVAVNRVWHGHFGKGLVETQEDFGIQGKIPSHPALLDFLAAEFIRLGWDLKKLHKLIVTSTTYKQTSAANGELLQRDPENVNLARGPRYRLEAEEIRDSALAISGLLSPRIGGPSVKPYQPAGLWEQAGTGKQYQQDKGEGLYRRSLYTFWRRTAPPPTMLIFDAPSRETCVARRAQTATPLQALVLMNDPQFIEASRVLAQRLLEKNDRGSVQFLEAGFRLITGRRPSGQELEVLQRLFRDQEQLFQQNPEAAKKFLTLGEAPANKSLPSELLAAATVVVSTMMNLDEFITKR